ncbi:RBPJ-interacting and tubulin-associated protein 1 [Elgaria multicarinata webbii]|uniref:RBPJ-interacting and tubulin-associated protein 1 n=1 Tax=Elgaria multicarinata webbii TaxID=159646 RepID=UPI002FCCCA86
MKASAELGIQALQLQRRGKGCRVKAQASYVDESLFGSPAGRPTTITEFDPPWVDNKARSQRPLLWSPATPQWETDASPSEVSPPSSTPRKRHKYRLKSHTPSYCDETLFGPKPVGQEWAAPWMAKRDAAKLRPLLWTPPSAPRDRSVLSLPPKETPLRAINQATPNLQEKERFGAQYRGGHSFRKHPESYSDPASRGVSRRPRSQSLTRLCSSSDQFQPWISKPRTGMPQDPLLPVASTGSLSRSCSRDLSGSSSARITRAASICKPKPPWK